jgi:hypothetical protein
LSQRSFAIINLVQTISFQPYFTEHREIYQLKYAKLLHMSQTNVTGSITYKRLRRSAGTEVQLS